MKRGPRIVNCRDYSKFDTYNSRQAPKDCLHEVTREDEGFSEFRKRVSPIVGSKEARGEYGLGVNSTKLLSNLELFSNSSGLTSSSAYANNDRFSRGMLERMCLRARRCNHCVRALVSFLLLIT